jgi:predicted nucleic acid-binding Zn ribbon protein
LPQRLASIIQGLDSGVAAAIRNCQLTSLWAEVIDERLSRHTEAVKIKERVLYVGTSNSVWANELTYLKKELIEKFNRLAGEGAIRDIKFKTMEVN